ncbi:MAG: hypothetical protein PVG14_13350 [Anaerolineales bacterium]
MPKQELLFTTRIMNAAGALGFAPDNRGLVDFTLLSAFITNPVSMKSRAPARGERCLSFPGGFLIHTGLPNPGLKRVVQRYARRWERSAMPIIVHLVAQYPDELTAMIERLELIEAVMGIEIGLPPDVDPMLAYDLVSAALGELPIIVRLPMERGLELGLALGELGVSAFSLAPPRGSLISERGELVSGRLYGPSVYPIALRAVQNMVEVGISVIGSGGLFHDGDVDSMLATGAMAVQLDAVLWRGGTNFVTPKT